MVLEVKIALENRIGTYGAIFLSGRWELKPSTGQQFCISHLILDLASMFTET